LRAVLWVRVLKLVLWVRRVLKLVPNPSSGNGRKGVHL
jgi:hypothetical protein